jgi:Ni2+-binding GTPase involved in maturation of urease and hydrogenase
MANINIIGFTGKIGAGKSTAVQILHDHLVSNKRNIVVTMNFEDPLKEAIKHLFNFTDEQVYGDEQDELTWNGSKSARQVLQWLGTDVMRKNTPDHFVILMNARIESLRRELQENDECWVLIGDVQYKNEEDFIHTAEGKEIRILREMSTHVLEQGLSFYDDTVLNDGTLESFKTALINQFESLRRQKTIL